MERGDELRLVVGVQKHQCTIDNPPRQHRKKGTNRSIFKDWFCNRPTDSTQTERMVHCHRRADEVCTVGLAVMWPWTWKQLAAAPLWWGKAKPTETANEGQDLVRLFRKKDYICREGAKKVSMYARWYSLLRVNFTLNSRGMLRSYLLTDNIIVQAGRAKYHSRLLEVFLLRKTVQ